MNIQIVHKIATNCFLKAEELRNTSEFYLGVAINLQGTPNNGIKNYSELIESYFQKATDLCNEAQVNSDLAASLTNLEWIIIDGKI